MTKTQWKEILEELKSIRSTNKFKTTDITYCEGYGKPVKDIRKVNTEELYIRFTGRDYISHDDMLWETPNAVRSRFRMTINPLYVEKINYK